MHRLQQYIDELNVHASKCDGSVVLKGEVSPHLYSTCTSYVLYTYMYLYRIYVLVGGEISLSFTYICAVL